MFLSGCTVWVFSLLCKRESTPVLRQVGSLMPSNHSPAVRNQSKVDVSMPPRWWMGLTREMMDDQGGHVCFISCRMSYYGNTAAPVTSGWPVSKKRSQPWLWLPAGWQIPPGSRETHSVWLRKDFCESIQNVLNLSLFLGFKSYTNS